MGYAGWQRQGYLAAAPAGPMSSALQTVAPLGTASAALSRFVAPQVKALARPRLETKSLGDEGGRFRGGGADHRQIRFDAQ